MGVAEGDFNGDGRPDLFVTNSRGQPHAGYESVILKNGETGYRNVSAMFAKALDRKATVGWGDSFVDLANNGKLDLILANGAIPVTSLKQDTEPLQVLQGLGGGRFTNASGIIDPNGMPKIIGRGLAAADYANDGRMAVAINTIGGPLVLLQDTGPVGHWLEVSLKGFQAGAVLTATLPNGRTLVQELHAGSSYLSSADPRAHFGLGSETRSRSSRSDGRTGRFRTSRTWTPTGSSRSHRPVTEPREPRSRCLGRCRMRRQRESR